MQQSSQKLAISFLLTFEPADVKLIGLIEVAEIFFELGLNRGLVIEQAIDTNLTHWLRYRMYVIVLSSCSFVGVEQKQI